MASNVNCTPEEAAIRELEEDLPSLACHAAIELDDIILGCEPRTEALGRLLSYLRNVMPRANQVLDPTTAVVMNRAIGDLPTGRRAATVDELVKEAGQITDALARAVADPSAYLRQHRAGLVRLRVFCLALSKRASAYRMSVDDLKVRHPFRRISGCHR